MGLGPNMEHEFIEWDWAQIWSMNLLNGGTLAIN